MAMVDWPDLDELKQVLDVTSSDWDGDTDDTRLTAVLGAAIDQTKLDVGNWVDGYDEPDYSLQRAALRLAELCALKPEVAAAVTGGGIAGVVTDPVYNRFLHGHRRVFGIA